VHGAVVHARRREPLTARRLADYAACLAGLIKRLGVRPVHLCGLSWGGVVALQMYADHPYLVKDLVLADTYAGWKGSFSRAELQARISGAHHMLGTSRADFEPNLRGLFAGSPPNSAMSLLNEIAKDVRRNSLATQLAAIAEADLAGALHRVGVPTLLIWGERDERSPLSVARQFERLIPDATLVVIPNCGHMSNLQRPQEFNEAVRAFCRANA
jgi:pimeloyl-ACP methyl ester carboxylesterase